MPASALSKTLISIVGATAVGKTALAIKVAQHLHTEIISADSRQFFKEMEIGTAKPSAEELAAAPHHFIGSHTITELFSTGDFEIQAMALLGQLFEHKDEVVLVGGSGLYVNAILNGLDELPATDLGVRADLNEQFQAEGLDGIKAQLASLDPEYYAQVDQYNTQRVIRGLEFVLSTGKKLSSFQRNSKKSRPFNIIKIGLNKDRQLLYKQINQRVDQMMDLGLLEEVKRLLPYREVNALKTVGYTELFDYLDGACSLPEAVDKIKQNTRRFAKRQLTWFRKDEEIKWFEPEQTTEILNYIDQHRSV